VESPSPAKRASGIPTPWAGAFLPAVALVTLSLLTDVSRWTASAWVTSITEGGIALLIFISAGGYGHLIGRRILPASAPAALRLATSCGLGLWGFSTALLLIGSLIPGALTWIFLWWGLLLAGLALAGWQAYPALRKQHFPERVSLHVLVWALLAVSVGIWLTGATHPPGTMRSPDVYDVLEYHLQVPREYYDHGQIIPLKHNVYSNYPLGTHMLFLFGMGLRGGAYAGMYVAQFVHGFFALLSGIALYGSLKPTQPRRALGATLLLGTSPFVLYMTSLAMVELSLIAYMTLAILWLREWLDHPTWRSAMGIGLACGLACATKYLSVGLVVVPLVGAMLLGTFLSKKRRIIAHLLLVGMATAILFSPWLIRNAICTRNPVFPLATTLFGRGEWSPESQQRWLAGHAPEVSHPVPKPAQWQPPPPVSRTKLFYRNLLADPLWMTLAIPALLGALSLLLRVRRTSPWQWGLICILAVQFFIWWFFTHQMPARFLAPGIGVMAVLSAEFFFFLENLIRRKGVGLVLTMLTAGLNLGLAINHYRNLTHFLPPIFGIPAETLIEADPVWSVATQFPANSRILLLGDSKAFYYPPNTLYATVFDANPLMELIQDVQSNKLTLTEAQNRLDELGVTHVVADWQEIYRLANSYGFPDPLGQWVWDARRSGQTPRPEILHQLGFHPIRDFKESPTAWTPITLYERKR
jgi:hypothetical protein